MAYYIGHNDHWLQHWNEGVEYEATIASKVESQESHHPKKMTNTFSKTNDEQFRITSTTGAVLELQESKICPKTTISKKMTEEAKSFAKGAM